MEQAAILKSGEVIKITGLLNPKYSIYGFLNSFEANVNGVTKKFRETVKEDFRDVDLVGQVDKDVIGGFYEEDFFLEYLIDKNKLYELKHHKYPFKPASVDDEIIVKKLKVVAPYTDFCKIETYKWSHQPNTQIVDYGTWQIKIPTGVFPDPIEGGNVQLNNTAMQFYNHKIGLFVTPLTDVDDKQAKAFLIAKIAIQINSIESIFNSIELGTSSDFGQYINSQKSEWSTQPIFVNPTVQILEDYMRNLTSFYEGFYANQISIKKAPKKEQFYWLARCLSAEALATVPTNDKIELLKNISYYEKKLTEKNGGESLVLKIVESFTFNSVSAAERNDFLFILMEIQVYQVLGTHNREYTADTKQTLFEILYSKIDDNRIGRYTYGLLNSYDNRKNFIFLLYKVWELSKYNPKYGDPSYTQPKNAFGIYPESYYMKLITANGSSIALTAYYDSETSPAFIYYDSRENTSRQTDTALISNTVQYTLGDIEGKKIKIHKEITTTVTNFKSTKENSQTISNFKSLYGTYDIYQPISIIGFKPDLNLVESLNGLKINSESQEYTPIIPVFLLYYMQDYSDLKKIDFGIMLTAEIAMNLTGAGALSDLKYIGYLSKMRPIWAAETAAGSSDAVLAWSAVNGVTNAVEFTAFNAMSINNYVANTTTDSETKEVAEKMNSFLMWTTITSQFVRPYTKSKVIESAFELDNTVAKFNQQNISIYRDMTSTQIQELDQALDVVKNIAGNKELVINTVIQKLTEQGTESDKILQKYGQITSTAEKYAFYVDLGFFEDPAIRKIFNTNDAKAIDNWRLCYANNITKERKYINILTNDKYVNGLVRFYREEELGDILETLEIAKEEKFLDTFSNISDTHFANFVENPNLIKEWEKYSFVSRGNDLSILSTEQKFKFLKSYENSPKTVVDRIKNGGLIKYYKIVDENPLNAIVHNSHIKNVDFLEDLRNTFTVKKQYPVDHVHHPGLQETIANHVKGSPVMLNHNGSDYIIGFTGMHADYAITEPNPITLIEATLPGGKKYYPGPLPTVNANIQTAIIDGTEIAGVGVKDCEVWMWGYVTKKVDGIESLYLDTNRNPIKTWVKKSNSNKTTIFTGINEDKALIEITYARHNLTLSDWIPHRSPGRPSNTWRGWSSEGVELHICIGTELMNPPTIMPSRKLPYGTVIPKNN
ncbi:hypothetical protein [Flavobacterium defluvii]|uniref:Uncharacterized protein n=1 Tax=Flavobacterium defluvii TaxID=370979 RepID=A0A1M5RKX0_9FLAO|nr:hypothetical protein [Flavobacterium defluvii]SHH26992.1 hypothetical protein SAMN05443663_106247 [Flavobacterium defluvii]